MKNRELEVVLLKEMQKIRPQFQIKPMVDFKHSEEKTLPRVVSRTLNNSIVERYEERKDRDKGIYQQIEVHRHTITFTFTLSKKESEEDVEMIRNHFSHIVGSEWWIDRERKELVIEEITDLIDISEYTKDGYTERYSFDMIVRTLEENIAEIEHIEKVELELKIKGGISWELK
ncbi:phage neck terminator protein [Fusobacterium necrophorum]|uniref:phage neck terminator protein n=1 Tax=Fusobacterium necrophorum TaxID=859 RepID=UPI00254A667D|nr:hypothetical protein [Fusobacterium necrophorum]MDK4517122.1 hypothetical protein [Fusobacterium necrophorum]